MAFKLQPNPTFKAKVEIPAAGGEPESIEFTFKHRSRKVLQDYIAGLADKSDADLIMDVACGWELTDEFNLENVTLLSENYIKAPAAIWVAYMGELSRAKEKN